MKRLALVAIALAACRAHDAADVPSAPPPVASVPVATATAPTAAASAVAPPVLPPSVATDWCIEGVRALAEDVCYVLPARDEGPPKALLVYLHGIVPPSGDSPQKHTVESAVLAAATRAGVAAIIPRGRRGIGPGDQRDWWAWPTTSDAYARLTPALVARWVEAKRALEGIAGGSFERIYLAGSSNGAYYVTALALRGDLVSAGFPVDGFGAISGGAATAAPAPAAAPRPFYVGYGSYDAESATRARTLGALLDRASWPVRVAEHPFGHGAREVYLDEALAFWTSAAPLAGGSRSSGGVAR